MKDAMKIASLAALKSDALSNASPAMKSDMVKPIPVTIGHVRSMHPQH
jgi:hypothetical protein